MLQAILARKLTRPEEELEDLLTSSVFGSLQYAGDETLVLEFLGLASSADGSRPLAFLPPCISLRFRFWPWLRHGDVGCEPDVVLTIEHADASWTTVLIEAKLKSGKGWAPEGNVGPRDQLAREAWCLASEGQHRRCVVYLTADFAVPRASLLESEAELLSFAGESGVPIAWTTWRALAGLLARRRLPAILTDLLAVLRKLHLTFYEGLPPLGDLPRRFLFNADDEGHTSWRFDFPAVHPPTFRFHDGSRSLFAFASPPTCPPWRFDSWATRLAVPRGAPQSKRISHVGRCVAMAGEAHRGLNVHPLARQPGCERPPEAVEVERAKVTRPGLKLTEPASHLFRRLHGFALGRHRVEDDTPWVVLCALFSVTAVEPSASRSEHF